MADLLVNGRAATSGAPSGTMLKAAPAWAMPASRTRRRTTTLRCSCLEAGHDALPEGDERFAVSVAVTSLDGHALTAQAHQMDSVVGVIVNDDVLPQGFDPAVDHPLHLPLDVLH